MQNASHQAHSSTAATDRVCSLSFRAFSSCWKVCVQRFLRFGSFRHCACVCRRFDQTVWVLLGGGLSRDAPKASLVARVLEAGHHRRPPFCSSFLGWIVLVLLFHWLLQKDPMENASARAAASKKGMLEWKADTLVPDHPAPVSAAAAGVAGVFCPPSCVLLTISFQPLPRRVRLHRVRLPLKHTLMMGLDFSKRAFRTVNA